MPQYGLLTWLLYVQARLQRMECRQSDKPCHEQAIMRRRQTVCGSVDTGTPRTNSVGYCQLVFHLAMSYSSHDTISGVKPAHEDVDNRTLSQLKAPISRSFVLLILGLLLKSRRLRPELSLFKSATTSQVPGV